MADTRAAGAGEGEGARAVRRPTRRGGGKGKRGGGAASGGADRALEVRVRTARGRKLSSTRWLQRQLNDPYVAAARREGYRSRAAYKLIELNERFKFLKKGARVVDLGAAPGGWTQVAVALVGAPGAVVAIDCQAMEPVSGARCAEMDFLDPDAGERLGALLGGPVDVVLSDMAAPSTGHRQTDHMRIMALFEAALAFALGVLSPGGAFVAKVLKGGAENTLLVTLKRHFRAVRHAKPKSSRADSAESYVVAMGFKGRSSFPE